MFPHDSKAGSALLLAPLLLLACHKPSTRQAVMVDAAFPFSLDGHQDYPPSRRLVHPHRQQKQQQLNYASATVPYEGDAIFGSSSSNKNNNNNNPTFASASVPYYRDKSSSSSTRTQTNTIVDLPDHVSLCNAHNEFGKLASYLAPEQDTFCVNYGRCKEDYEFHPLQPCDCDDDHEGPHCEFDRGRMPPCERDCGGGRIDAMTRIPRGECVMGLQHWHDELPSNYWKHPVALEHCVCAHGFTGENCLETVELCGDQNCQNGGTCVNLDRGGTEKRCDCSAAVVDGVHFGGVYCEAPASEYCNDGADHNGHQFCLNGGTCRGKSHEGCNCAEGFTGPVCEFVVSDVDFPDCDLQCFNKGVCRHGAKDLSLLDSYGVNRHMSSTSRAYSEDFMHCVCPRGFVGLQCEFEMEICPGGAHMCMHGGECDPFVDQDIFNYKCDCTHAEGVNTRFAGIYCEMPSTEFCTEDGLKTERGNGMEAFCTNRGECIKKVPHGEPHPGCHCNAGQTGWQCEIEVDERSISTNSGRDPLLIASWIIGMTAVVVLLVALALLIERKRRHDRQMSSGFDWTRYAHNQQPPTLENIALETNEEQEIYESRDAMSCFSHSSNVPSLTDHHSQFSSSTTPALYDTGQDLYDVDLTNDETNGYDYDVDDDDMSHDSAIKRLNVSLAELPLGGAVSLMKRVGAATIGGGGAAAAAASGSVQSNGSGDHRNLQFFHDESDTSSEGPTELL